MKPTTAALLAGAGASALAFAATPAAAQDLRVFIGGQQRPDVVRPLLDRYQEANPGVSIELEVGGATSELQQQYLTTVLTSQDDALDVFLIDVVRPAQYAAAGWAEPLDSYLGDERDAVLDRYLPVYAEADVVNGEIVALPAFADAMFLYYRADLLEEHGFEPPETWEELMTAASAIQEAEGDDNLQGLSYQGAAIEGANCTFLVPYWGAGGTLTDAEGNVDIDEAAAEQAFGFLLDTIESGVTKANIAEVGTDDTRREFQAGNVIFAINWAYAWNRFQTDEDSAVAGDVGVVPLPAFEGGEPATCIGGWQWAVSAFSSNKEAAVDLVRFLSGPEGSKHLAINASNLPVIPGLYEDPEVLEVNPWFEFALPVVLSARSRPQSPRYPEVSDTIRTEVNAVLAGIKEPEAAITDMEARLQRVLR
ncbi:MAG: ABC transporter substrate-binding protein [Azospirillaceae bacterium]